MTAVGGLTPEQEVVWHPFAGKQTDFLAASEFEVLFGGAKGPGKSDCLLMGGTRQVDRPRYKALILRETYGDLQELIDRSHRLFPKLTPRPVWQGEPSRWVWPSGASLTFGYCADVKDVERYQGKEWGYIGYDELGNVQDPKIWELLMAECRCPDPSVIRMMRGSANPGKAGHAWIKRRFVDTCGKDGAVVHAEEIKLLDGRKIILTRRYVPATVLDNPIYRDDPFYMAQLMRLPEVLRRQLLYGDWDAGYGAALDELRKDVHLIPPFRIPSHWEQFGAFDWGYAHPWVFGWFAVDEDGSIYCIDTMKGRHEKPHEIARAIVERGVPVAALNYVHAGHDTFNLVQARGENTPTIAEALQEFGINCTRASIARVEGLNNLRKATAWKTMGKDGGDATPILRFFDTPNNRWGYDQLESMIVNPDRMEDVLKVNADQVTGEGGDDFYDMVRYAAASRPLRAPSTFLTESHVRPFSVEALHYTHELMYRDGPAIDKKRQRMVHRGWR